MITTISEELYIFLATIYGGILIGLIYDLYRIIRGIFRPKKIATIVEDLIFWIIIAITAFFVLLFSNDGQLRFYTFLGFGIGATMYIWILSPYVVRSIVIIMRLIKKTVYKIYNIIMFPIKKLIMFLKVPVRWIIKKLRPGYLKFKRLKKLPETWIKEMKKDIKLIIRKK